MNVLVTGATGFVASHLIPQLVAAGHTVLAAGHDPARLARFEGATPLLWNLRQAPSDEVLAALPEQLDAVLHLAQANVPFPAGASDMFAVHVEATQQLLELARTRGTKRFVFASTGSVYAPAERPWRESDRATGPGYYAATKLAAEALIQGYGELVPHTIFRLFVPYGPGQTGRLVPGLINRVRTGQAVTVASGQGPRFNPLYISHVVEAFTQALDAEGNQLLNLGGNEVLSVRQMAETIGRELRQEPLIQHTPGAGPRDVVGDTTAFQTAYRLPDRPTTFAEGVRAMLAASLR